MTLTPGLIALWVALAGAFALLVAWRYAAARGIPLSNARGAALYALVAGALALYGVLYGGVAVAKLAASQEWPAAEGRITRAEVIAQPIAGRGISGQTWSPVVAYEYSVGGTTYGGDRLAFALTTHEALRRIAEAQLAPYQPGDTAPVFYNPRAPADSVLERRVDLQAWLALGGGLLLLTGHLLAVGRQR